jgi:hypothetical protein
VLEFQFTANVNPTLMIERRNRRLRELVLLLNLLAGPIKQSSTSAHHRWVLSLPQDTGPLQTLYLQEGYYFPGYPSQRDSFSSLSQFTPMNQVDSDKFFKRIGIQMGDTFDVPVFLHPMTTLYHTLDQPTKDRFLRACFWYQHARNVRRHSTSASFMALINAIEVLVDRRSNGNNCDKCGKSLSPSSTQLFIDFLDHYAPSKADYSSARRKLYRIRGALTHGWDLFTLDTRSWIHFRPRSLEEHRDLSEAQHLTRFALLQWLASQAV